MKNNININIKVTVAENAGFCFGVRRATDAVEYEIKNKKENQKIYTLGKLIHNRIYMEQLEKTGVSVIDENKFEEADIDNNSIIVTRAHGITRELCEKLSEVNEKYPDMRISDCTCPYVTKIQDLAEKNSGDKKLFILIGDPDHPEVKGIMSHIEKNGLVFSSPEELDGFLKSQEMKVFEKFSVYMAAQTTQNLEKWKNCQKIIKKVYTNAIIFDTICSVTEDRQLEAEKLAQTQDIVFVIGGKDSSNTAKLNDICSHICSSTFWIESAEDIDIKKLNINPEKNYYIGITAGASTPDSIIQEVTNKMNEQTNSVDTQNLTFAEMLEDSIKTLNTGDTVTGVITSISQNEIHLDLGTKTTGVIVHEQITDDPSVRLDELFKVGDEVEAFVIKVSDVDGIATLSKKRIDSTKNWKQIVDAGTTGEILTGKIVEAVKGGVIISINSVRIFIPASMTGVPKDGDLQSLVGTTQRVKIVEIKEERKRAYASIREVKREERRQKEEAFWSEIEEGKQYDGEVKNLTVYGAFVDIGGVDGMVHTSELSWKRVKHPSEVVNVGDKIKVFVKSFDREKKRISLGYKTEDSDPWFIFNQKYSVGNTATVKIVSLMPFGAFAEIVPGVDGLIHISQIARQKIAKPGDVLEMGQEVEVKITEVNQENRQIGLSIRALLDEADEAAAESANDGETSGMVYSTDNPDSYANFDVEE